MKILVINPGSTSTKIALYKGAAQLWMRNIGHSVDDLSPYKRIAEQLDMRKTLVLDVLAEENVKITDLSAIAARGGLMPPVHAGAYEVNQEMVDQLLYHTELDMEHASNLAALIAYHIAQPVGIPVYIYDSVMSDEMLPIARVTGFKEILRMGRGHNLNCRAAFMEYARQEGKPYQSVTASVVHLGGGITVSIIQGGRIIDIMPDDEGPFAPERAGGLPYYKLLDMAMDGGYDKATLIRKIRTQGGYMSYFGTTDHQEVERRMREGDEKARFIFEALALNVAKNIAKLSAIVCGNLDAIILTGGIAHSKLLTERIGHYVSFVAPIVAIPGENEMQALANGVLRVLNGEEEARVYKTPADSYGISLDAGENAHILREFAGSKNNT